jgi:hypothetical protein
LPLLPHYAMPPAPWYLAWHIFNDFRHNFHWLLSITLLHIAAEYWLITPLRWSMTYCHFRR